MSFMQPGNPNKRLRFFATVIVVLGLIFVGRLVQIQIFQAGDINKVSLASRSVTQVVPAIRGQIQDSTGKALAKTVLKYDINVAPVNVKAVSKKVNGVTTTIPVEQIAAQMAGIMGMTPEEVLAKIIGTGQYSNMKRGVNTDVYAQLKKLDIPWVYYDAVPSRTYPSGALAGSLIGFLTTDGKPMGGIESEMNSCLAGVDGKDRKSACRERVSSPV